MEAQQISFEHLPRLVYELGRKVDDLTNLLSTRAESSPPDRWMSANELREYLPSKPAKATIYGLVQRREIPFGREGKNLIFLKSQIDQWLLNKSNTTATSVAKVAEDHLLSVNRKPRRKGAVRR